ncbi:hypothetical protein MRB53_039502 [Persea americana]|nr:hypothetical protein MRB53_039502 [Persea americana]
MGKSGVHQVCCVCHSVAKLLELLALWILAHYHWTCTFTSNTAQRSASLECIIPRCFEAIDTRTHSISLQINAASENKAFSSTLRCSKHAIWSIARAHTALWLSLFGFLTGWIHLRFYRISDLGASETSTGGNGAQMRGDPSETFAFVEFFPDILKPILSPICDAVFATLVSIRVCTPFSEEAIEAATEASRDTGLPGIMDQRTGGRRAEAERRRALALKALDQRLNAAAASRNNAAIVIAKPETEESNVEEPAASRQAEQSMLRQRAECCNR